MSQFWTPLAKTFGLTENEQPKVAVSKCTNSNWPELYELFQEYAISNWITACKRHQEISPNDVMSIRQMTIQAGSMEIQSQIDSWCAEGTPDQLIDWMIKGPWSTPEILNCVIFEEFTKLLFIPFVPNVTKAKQSQSAYEDAEFEKNLLLTPRILLTADHMWVTSSKTGQTNVPEQIQHRVGVEVDDADGLRNFALKGNLFIFGHSQAKSCSDGDGLRLMDGQTIEWQGESATFICIQGHHVSGMHMALRTNEKDFDFQDLGSSNGTFEGKQAIQPFIWHSSLGHKQLHLGGPAEDCSHESPCLRITTDYLEKPAKALQLTPLRKTISPVKPVMPISVIMHVEGTNGWKHELPIAKLPFLVGRDLHCDCQIPEEFSKVSRQHLVILELDTTKQAILIQDVSTHGVVIHNGTVSGDIKYGAWLTLGCELALGVSKNLNYVNITFTINYSNKI